MQRKQLTRIIIKNVIIVCPLVNRLLILRAIINAVETGRIRQTSFAVVHSRDY